MLPRDRGRRASPTYRGRGRGYQYQSAYNQSIYNTPSSSQSIHNASPSDKGSIHINPDHPLYKEIMESLKKANDKTATSSASYAEVVLNDDSEDHTYSQSSHKDIIIFLRHIDLKYKDDPWILMEKYLEPALYAIGCHKPRIYAEKILMQNSYCEIRHFEPYTGPKTYHVFSKCIIKKILSPEDWGISTLREKQFLYNEDNRIPQPPQKYNYWDYTQSFTNCFLYENPMKKHSWLFKICPEVYNQEIPGWFIKWWQSYGPSISILPDPFKTLYDEWVIVSPKILEAQQKRELWFVGLGPMYFFIEFGIPWIWKWKPEVGHDIDNILCLKRTYYTKFWVKMLQKEANSDSLHGQQTIDLIKERILQYKEDISLKQQENIINPFHYIQERLLMTRSDPNVSKEELIDSYINNMEENILKDLEDRRSISPMSLSSSDNRYMLLQDAQDPYEDDDTEDLDGEIEKINRESEKKKKLQEAFALIRATMKEKNKDNSEDPKDKGKKVSQD